jgi:hypothetical protein
VCQVPRVCASRVCLPGGRVYKASSPLRLARHLFPQIPQLCSQPSNIQNRYVTSTCLSLCLRVFKTGARYAMFSFLRWCLLKYLNFFMEFSNIQRACVQTHVWVSACGSSKCNYIPICSFPSAPEEYIYMYISAPRPPSLLKYRLRSQLQIFKRTRTLFMSVSACEWSKSTARDCMFFPPLFGIYILSLGSLLLLKYLNSDLAFSNIQKFGL